MSAKTKSIKLPGLGRLGFIHETSGQGVGNLAAEAGYIGHLEAQVMRKGRPVQAQDVMKRWARFWGNVRGSSTVIDLGTGLVTNVGVLSMANDPFWSAQLNLATLALANQHATGTGATAAAVTDIALQTVSTHGGQTPVAGTQSLVPSGTAPAYKSIATISYTGTEAVTEWGLHSNATLSSATGSPFTATSANSGTDTGSAQTASSATVRGQQGMILVPGTTAVWSLITANTTHVFTVPAWYNQSNGAAGSTPGSTEAFTVKAVMWDHKVFSAINVLNGDSIQFTYTLTVNSGG